MGVLSYRTGLTTVENALADVITLALGERMTALANVAALRSLPTRGASGMPSAVERAVRYVTGAGCYMFRAASTATDNGTTVIKPTDNPNAGRWLLQSSSILAPDGTAISQLASGYLRGVLLYEGERTGKEWDLRILARRPAVVVQYVGEDKEQKSNLRGALAIKRYRFNIWGVSFSARPNAEGAIGSPVAAEAARDPGVKQILGDLEDLLDGLTGAQLGVDGVDFLSFGETSPTIEDLAHREFIWTAPLVVRATVGKEDRPPRVLMDAVTAQGVTDDGLGTPLTPQFQVIP